MMNRWSSLASMTLVAGAIGHFVVVDLSVWILEAEYVHWAPESLLQQARSTIIDWGFIGQTTFLKAFSGFSLWMVVSLITIAVYNFLIFKYLPHGHSLRMKSLTVGLISAVAFLIIATLCFINPAAIGGGLAVAFFIMGIVTERGTAKKL